MVGSGVGWGVGSGVGCGALASSRALARQPVEISLPHHNGSMVALDGSMVVLNKRMHDWSGTGMGSLVLSGHTQSPNPGYASAAVIGELNPGPFFSSGNRMRPWNWGSLHGIYMVIPYIPFSYGFLKL